MSRPGLRTMHCEVCGEELELETGIRNMYHCAELMVEVEDGGAPLVDEQEPDSPPALRLRPRQ